MGNSNIRRYMGGKRPEKYFKEDLWPPHQDTLMKLGLDFQKAQKIFLIFCKIDTDESGSVDVDEAFEYMGGARTRFTERIFDIEGKVDAKQGLPFGAFAVVLWNFCSFTPENMARYIFEIFDVDRTGYLERPDVETMYRMMYDCDDFDPRVVAYFPFDKDGTIKKTYFTNHASHFFSRQLIQPALDYQYRLRRYLGGALMWEGLSRYRERYYKSYADKSETLEDTLAAILASENKHKSKTADADEIMLAKKRELDAQIAESKMALKRRETQLQLQLKRKITPEGRKLQVAEKKFYDHYNAFEKRQFTVDDIWERRELRDELFQLFDEYYVLKDSTRVETNNRNLILAEGVEEDHEARYQDYILTKEGKHELDRWILKEVITGLEKRYPPKETMTIAEANRASAIIEAKVKLVKLDKLEAAARKKADDLTQENPLNPRQPDLGIVLGTDVDFEMAFAKKTARSSDFKAAQDMVHTELRAMIMKRVMKQTQDEIVKINGLATREKLREEFKIITNFGSRDTRFEYVYDPAKEAMIYINIDTMQIYSEETCICEKCDAVYEQVSDKLCKGCGAPRSMKNQKFYKPLGV